MSWYNESELSLTELQNLEKLLVVKLEKLTQQSNTEDAVLSLFLLKFIRSLVVTRIKKQSPFVATCTANSAPVQYTYSYDTICTNCKAKNPTHTHCVHSGFGLD
jgi:hypothetical protein